MTGNDNRDGIVIRGKAVGEDAQGRIRLDDLWVAAGQKAGKAPKFWRVTQGYKALLGALRQKVGIPNHSADLIEAARGRGSGGTYAHPILAAAYAGYLDPQLEVEVREVWLRYRAGDATLADEILQRATDEANYWAGIRALARSGRTKFTDVLKHHGVTGKEGYMGCTEAVYQALLGGKSYEIRARMGLPPRTNLRDQLGATALASVMLAEALSAERIEEEKRFGNADCATATLRSARVVRAAVDDDRQNRRGAA